MDHLNFKSVIHPRKTGVILETVAAAGIGIAAGALVAPLVGAGRYKGQENIRLDSKLYPNRAVEEHTNRVLAQEHFDNAKDALLHGAIGSWAQNIDFIPKDWKGRSEKDRKDTYKHINMPREEAEKSIKQAHSDLYRN